jgi:hypothetical protein
LEVRGHETAKTNERYYTITQPNLLGRKVGGIHETPTNWATKKRKKKKAETRSRSFKNKIASNIQDKGMSTNGIGS